MMKQVRFIGLVTLLMTLGWSGRSFAGELLQATATRVTEPPVLDGKLTEECWKTAVPVTGFRQYGSETQARYQSFGYVLYNENNLYIGVRCSEPNPENIKTEPRKHDDNVFSDDAVEIMLKPDPSTSRYFQFAVNASGTTFDALRTHGGGSVDASWNGEVTAAAAIGEDHWSAELRIPFFTLELSPEVRSDWRINICRDKQRPHELSAIAREGQFNESWKFAVLSGLGVDFRKYCVQVGRPQLVGEIKNGTPSASATLSLTNNTGKDRRLKIEYLSDDVPAGKLLRAEELSLTAGRQASLNLGPASLKPLTAGQTNVYAVVETASARQLVVSDAESGERLALSNLRYPSQLKMLELDLVQSAASEKEAIQAGGRPMTIELVSCISKAERKEGNLSLKVSREDTSQEVTARSVASPARVTRLTLDRSRLPIGRLVLQVAFRGADGQPVAATRRSFVNLPAPEKVGKVLNNLVTELLNLKGDGLGSKRRFKFTNPRNGWLFFYTSVGQRLGAADRAEVSVPGETGEPVIVHEQGKPQTQEAMRWLPVGEYVLTVRTEGNAALENLIVRAIPELSFFRFPAGTHLPQQQPRFDWDVLQKHILHSVNTIACAGRVAREPFKSANQPYFDQWRKAGKRWLLPGRVPAYKLGPDMTAEQAYKFWAENPAYADPTWDGIIVDEFGVADYPVAQYAPMAQAVRQLTADFPTKRFYPFCLNMQGVKEVRPFIEAVIDNGAPIVWEWYEREEPDENRAKEKLASTLSQGMKGWRDFIFEAPTKMIICLGYYSAPPLSLNENPAVDYKVWMDMQFHLLATEPTFQGLYGLMEWNSKYTDEETLRWQARLYRHYGIEGKRHLLSRHYGFRYTLTHLRNPDFDEGTKGWTVVAAEDGRVDTGAFNGLGRLEGRVRGSARGDNFLRMKRSPKGPNRVVQEIRDLKPGQLYSLKMFTVDYQDLVKGRSVKQRHTVEIRIENVEVSPDRGFQEVFQSMRGQEVLPFSGARQPWLNYYWRLFRAKAATAKLTISDWTSADEPGGPLGQELLFNFVEVQPYFAEEFRKAERELE